MSDNILRIAMPRKGRIADQLGPLCKDAGYAWPKSDSGKALVGRIGNDIEVMFVRTTDIPALVADGVVDLGVTGTDVVDEAALSVTVAAPLPLFQCRLVFAGRIGFKEEYVKGISRVIKVATSFPNLAQAWADKVGIEIHLIPLSGSVEIAPRIGIADAIVDLTQTGSTLRTNGIEIIEDICDVEACVIAAPNFDVDGDSEKAANAQGFIEALTSVLAAKGKRYLMMNVPKDVLEQVKDIVPGLAAPTVLDLYGDSDIVAVHAVVERDALNSVIPQLRAVGVHGILVTPIERLIP